MKLKKGDKVQVIGGKDRGKSGAIDRVYPNSERILVTGVNMYKKHVRKNEQMPQGGIVDVARPMPAGKVMFLCPKCNKPARLGYQVKNGKKSRVCRSCDSIV